MYSCAIDHDGKQTLTSDFVLVAILRSRDIDKKLSGVVGHIASALVFHLEEKDFLTFMKFNWCAPDDTDINLDEWYHREELLLNGIIYHENGSLNLPIDIHSTERLQKQKPDKNYRQKALLWEIAPGPFRTSAEEEANKINIFVESIDNKDNAKAKDEQKLAEEAERERLKREKRSAAAKDRALQKKLKLEAESESKRIQILKQQQQEDNQFQLQLREQQNKTLQLERAIQAEKNNKKANNDSVDIISTIHAVAGIFNDSNKRSSQVESEVVKRQRIEIENEEKSLTEERVQALKRAREELMVEEKRIAMERAKEERILANEREFDNKKNMMKIAERDFLRTKELQDREWEAKLEAEKLQVSWEREKEAKKLAFEHEMAFMAHKSRQSYTLGSNTNEPSNNFIQKSVSSSSSVSPSVIKELELRKELLMLQLKLRHGADSTHND